MKLFAEVLEAGKVAATVIAGPGQYPLEDAPMVDLGRGYHEIEFSAEEGREYLLAVTLNGSPYSSVDFFGEADPPEPVELAEFAPPTPAPKAPKGVKFFRKRPF